MAFSRTQIAQAYVPSPPPSIEGSLPMHYDRELQHLRRSIESLRQAVIEIQEYLETLP